MQQLLDGLPESLKQTAVIDDLKVGGGCLSSGFRLQKVFTLQQKFRASGARIEDQLSDACSRGVVITPTAFSIRTLVQGMSPVLEFELH